MPSEAYEKPEDGGMPPPALRSESLPDAASTEATWYAVHLLIDQLTTVQERLGTPLEQKGDLNLVRGLGHSLQNKLTMLQLCRDLYFSESPPTPSANQPTSR